MYRAKKTKTFGVILSTKQKSFTTSQSSISPASDFAESELGADFTESELIKRTESNRMTLQATLRQACKMVPNYNFEGKFFCFKFCLVFLTVGTTFVAEPMSEWTRLILVGFV